jgi:hypothetical protein
LKGVAHIFYLEDAKQLAAAGLDGFAHSVRDQPVDDELIRLMKQHQRGCDAEESGESAEDRDGS